MFGYVTPEKPYLTLRDFALYRSVYCGICVSLKRNYGMVSRLATTYDAVFLSLLLHNYLDEDYKIEPKRCLLHPFRKRPHAACNDIDDTVCAFNLLLMYHKIGDDVSDEGGLRSRTAKLAFRKAYRRAKQRYPELDAIVRDRYAETAALEREGCPSIDRVADPFSRMLAEMTEWVLKDKFTPAISDFCYHVGKWIYLIDALDDLAEDFKKQRYNPFLAAFDDYVTRETFINRHREEIESYFTSAMSRINQRLDEIPFAFNTDLLKNITAQGLSGRTRSVLEGRCGCRVRI